MIDLLFKANTITFIILFILAQQSGNLTFQDQGIHNVDLTNRSCVISVNLHVCLFYLIFVRYGENKLIFNEMMMRSALY
jgi:hypothetical protein